MAWKTPTGDIDGDWDYASSIWDDNLGSYGSETQPNDTWTSFWTGTIGSIPSDRVRFYASTDTNCTVDIDVYRDGGWVHVYEGDYNGEAWVEKSFTRGDVTQARVRFYNGRGSDYKFKFYEFDFYESPLGDALFFGCNF